MLCVVSVAASSIGYCAVGAVSIAPSMVSSRSLVNEVGELNIRIDTLSNNIKKLEDKVWNYKDAGRVNVGGRVIPQSRERDEALSTFASRIMRFRFYVDRLKETNNIKNEAAVISLSVFVNMVSRDIEKYLNLSNFDLYMNWTSVRRDIILKEKRMKEIAQKMMDGEANLQGRSNNSNIRRQVSNNNNDVNVNNSNINNNIKNNLNDNDTVDVVSNLVEIRDLVTELNNEQNIMNRDAFIQSGKFKTVVDKFNMAFSYGRRGFINPRAHCFGMYSIIAGHLYSVDVTEQGKYVGQYPILNELYEAVQKLVDSYIFDNEDLSQEQFKNKVHQNATRVNGVLDRIVDLLGIE